MLRGERDCTRNGHNRDYSKFQLTRSVGSVTLKETVLFEQLKISTHTLRGERDAKELGINANTDNFNSHAPWGA